MDAATAQNPQLKLGSSLRDMANAIRALSMDAVEKANSGHPRHADGHGGRGDRPVYPVPEVRSARHPNWPDRDRFILSAGHGSMLLYSLLHLTGYADMTLERAQELPPIGLARPPAIRNTATPTGIETTTGPLGQGLGNSVGFALAERILERALRRRPGQPLHLRDRWRRLPDGRHQPGGDLARGASEARQADRAVRRQFDLDRRAHEPVRLGRSDRASRPRGWNTRRASTATIPKAIAAALEEGEDTTTSPP